MPRIITVTPNPTYDFAVEADFVEPNRKLRCDSPKSHPGGGGVNVARAASRLDADTLAILTTGGVYGAAVKTLLAEEGVRHRDVPVAHETRIAFHVRDRAGDQEYRFNLPGGAMSADEIEALLDAIASEAGDGDFVIGSGSLPGGEPDDFWARAAHTAKRAGAKFVLDSINGVVPALEEGVFLLRQNKFEYPAIAGRNLQWPDEIIDFAKSLVAAGKAEKVAITHGGDGSILASASGVARTDSVSVKAQSAVGAGDSFVAAMMVAMQRGADDQEAVRYAMCAAAATRISPGAALFDPKVVAEFFAQESERVKNSAQ